MKKKQSLEQIYKYLEDIYKKEREEHAKELEVIEKIIPLMEKVKEHHQHQYTILASELNAYLG